MFGCMGFYFRAVNEDISQFDESKLITYQKDLLKPSFELGKKPFTKTRNCVMVGVMISCNEEKSNSIVGRCFYFSDTKNTL